MDTEQKINIVQFLRELADSMETNKLSSDQITHIGEFYMEYIWRSRNNEHRTISTDKALRYLTLGWYIYEMLLTPENNTIDDDID